MPLDIETRDKPMDITLFGPRMATVSLGVLGMTGGAVVDHRHLWNGCVLGEQAAA